MISKVLTVFSRDLKVSLRNFVALYIIVFPVVLGVAVNLFVPGVNESTVSLAMIKGENVRQIQYLKDYAEIEILGSAEDVEARVLERDDILGILPEGEKSYYILSQGDEPEYMLEFAKMLQVFYENKVTAEDSRAEIVELGRTVPPMKKTLVSGAIMLYSVMGGMLIALNIVEEKADNTISAINVTPLSRLGYIAGKSLMGVLFPLVGTAIMLVITGFRDINFGQALTMVLVSSMVSVLVGFIEGVNNDDVINAAGNMKLLFLPLAGSIAAIELLSDRWQKFFYWSPFYWTYKGNELVLSKSGSWDEILLYAGIVLAISAVVFAVLAPRIRRGLE
ncbi:ABC-2 family transporter protein [Andreesenia angusta]|uniref:ABC-2 family transporter protein n=1 Tax=Andreesenia angusta TaxID=39480 RepID=A0A1S1V9T4_9FIRM|nr:ABC transporter permease [Andreesenia angusta]OHW63274.1 ABC-2 family transporter protein [Andreesenia angusta]